MTYWHFRTIRKAQLGFICASLKQKFLRCAPAREAVRRGNLEALKHMLEAKYTPCPTVWEWQVVFHDCIHIEPYKKKIGSVCAIHDAGRRNYVDMCKYLIEFCNVKLDISKIGLFIYAMFGNVALVRILLDDYGIRPIEALTRHAFLDPRVRNSKVFPYILEKADFNMDFKTLAFGLVSMLDYSSSPSDVIEKLQICFNNGVSPDIRNGKNQTLLHVVCRKHESHRDITAFLIKKGATPTTWDASGDTPIHALLRNGVKTAVVKSKLNYIKLGRDFDVNIQNGAGLTPLHFASKLNQSSTIYNN